MQTEKQNTDSNSAVIEMQIKVYYCFTTSGWEIYKTTVTLIAGGESGLLIFKLR